MLVWSVLHKWDEGILLSGDPDFSVCNCTYLDVLKSLSSSV